MGYKRSNRKKSKASTNLQDVDNAVGRYEEVVNLVKFGKDELNIFTEKEYIEDVIALSGEKYGEDWNFDHHIEINKVPTLENFQKAISDYLAWEVSQFLKYKEIDDSKKK